MELLFYIGVLFFLLVLSCGLVLLYFWLRLREEKKLFFAKQQCWEICQTAYETLFETTPELSIVVDSKKNIVAVNPVALRSFPSLKAIIGQPVEQITEPALRQILVDQCYELVSMLDHLYRPISTPLYRNHVRLGELVSLLDVTELRNQKRLQVLQEQIQGIVFEWDLINGRITYSPAYERQFGYSITGHASEEAHRNHYVHPDDLARLCAVQRDVCKGLPFVELEYRVRKVKNGVSEYAWVYVHAESVQDMTGRTIGVIGTIEDIDDKKKLAEQQNESLQYDALTGVLNLESIRRQVQYRLQTNPAHTQSQLFLIDLDRFHEFDRQYGHHNADLILKEIAGRLHSFFSSRDLIARMSGDRFWVYRELPHGAEDENQIEQWLQPLQKAIGNPMMLSEQHVQVTCCIGVVLYPQHGETVDLLFDNADKAVFLAKQKGGNCIMVYERPKV